MISNGPNIFWLYFSLLQSMYAFVQKYRPLDITLGFFSEETSIWVYMYYYYLIWSRLFSDNNVSNLL